MNTLLPESNVVTETIEKWNLWEHYVYFCQLEEEKINDSARDYRGEPGRLPLAETWTAWSRLGMA